MNNIKATDLLMKIYEDVKKIKETVMLQSFQYNLILKKLNDLELSNKTNRTNKTNVEENVNSFMIKSTESLPVGNFKAVETAPNVNSSFFEDSKDEFTFKEIVDEEPVQKELGQKGLAQKIPVTQLVYTENNKPVAIATVEIKDSNGNVLHKTKTNSVGRWSALLFPGQYSIHFVRRYGKHLLEFDQSFEVDSEKRQVEILPPEKYRRQQSKE